MNNQDIYEPYTAPPPSTRLVAIAAKWAKRASTVEQFNIFSDLSQLGGDLQILINDAALAIARRAATNDLVAEDEELAHEAREIIEWTDSVAEMRRAGAAPTWSPPKGVMTIGQWVKE